MRTRVVVGPPGTGKTTRLLGLVEEELARGTAPDRIGYLSFTRRAAHEAVTRACDKFRLERADFPHFSTLHSLCFRQLGMKRGDVLEGARLQEFARYANIRITGRISEDGTWSSGNEGDRVMFMIGLARIRGVPLKKLFDGDTLGRGDDGLSWHVVQKVARDLTEFKHDCNLRDYTDMLQEFVDHGPLVRLEALIVDEAQDLSWLQWRVIQKLSSGCRYLAVAGDDDQAIYRWAGADVDRLIEMEGEIEVLGQSWRVPPAVQRVANRIIVRVHRRREKKWAPRVGEEGVVAEAQGFEHVSCDEGQILVLARNSYVIREQVEPELRSQGIVYERNGHPSIRVALIEVIRNWERLRRGEEISIGAARDIYEYMSVDRGYRRGHKRLPHVRDENERVSMADLRVTGGLLRGDPWFEALDRIQRGAEGEVEYIRAALRRGEKLSGRPRVVVSTIHGSKGGEADHVVLLKEMAGRTWREMKLNPDDERRVWYVGCTRARRKLTIVQGTSGRACPWI